MSSVNVYLFDDYDALDENFISNNIHLLPASRAERCMRFRQDIDKINCTIAYLMLKYGLEENFGISSEIEFVYNEYKKPFLKEFPQIFFNFSHCKRGVVCAIADFEIGVDIQDFEPFNINVARRVCSKNELIELDKSDNPSRLFCRFWTQKESYAKAMGVGIGSVLNQDLCLNNFWYYENELYCLTVFCENKNVKLIMNDVGMLIKRQFK